MTPDVRDQIAMDRAAGATSGVLIARYTHQGQATRDEIMALIADPPAIAEVYARLCPRHRIDCRPSECRWMRAHLVGLSA
jgi:hypothetical protein